MSDYNNFCFSVEEKDVLNVLRAGAAAGVSAMLYVNGMYYTVNLNQEEVNRIREEEKRRELFWEV